MSFRITGLPAEPFRHLFGLSDQELATKGVIRRVVDSTRGLPDRVEIRDAVPGETVLLLNYTHQPANTPFQASHAIFVREGASERYDRTDEVPPAMRQRTLSLRAFDKNDIMIDADLVEGASVETLIGRFFANPQVSYIQAHYAKWGCYAARIDRVRYEELAY